MENRDLIPNVALQQEPEYEAMKSNIAKTFRALFDKGYSRADILAELTNELFKEVNATALKMRVERASRK